MTDREQWASDQLEGLRKLADVLHQHEINFVLVPMTADMAYIEMCDTPRGPHAIFDPHSKTYDIWKWGRKRPGMKYSDLSAEDAAEILITEYFMAKAKRVRKNFPDMSMTKIMETLRHGYQKKQRGEPSKIQ